MIKRLPFFSLFILLISSSVFAQSGKYHLPLKTMMQTPPALSSQEVNAQLEQLYAKGAPVFIIQFYSIPDSSHKKALRKSGLVLKEYIGGKAYFASYLKEKPQEISLSSGSLIRSVLPLLPEYKIDPELKSSPLPDYTIKDGQLLIYASLFDGIEAKKAESELKRMNWKILRYSPAGRLFELQINREDLERLAEMSWVRYIEKVSEPGSPENFSSAIANRASALNGMTPGNMIFDGRGVNVQLQDDGYIGPHADYKNRIQKQFTSGNFGNHGDHTGGTVMGAGNIDPRGRGMAPGAQLYVYDYDPFNDSILSHHDKYGIVISSTSYSNGCNDGYTATAKAHDRSVITYPDLMHVFSAGNSNNSNCGYGAGTQWGNITGGHKVGKNVMTVANTSELGVIASSSSRGPAHDGRIKPDVSAKGTSVYSTVNPNSYEYKTGTSMSCPAVAGSMALLYNAYKSSHNGTNPPSALIKCYVLNSAKDLGNKGPDFIYGWGLINNLAAADLILNDAYFTDSIGQNEEREFVINVPDSTAEARIMLYWHDLPALNGANKALVNDLDLFVISPAGDTLLPYVLSSAPNTDSLRKPARQGRDHLNNMEQVFIDLPAAGNYRAVVKGYEVPEHRQTFYLSYYLPKREIRLIFPNGGEGLDTRDFDQYVSWDNFSKNNELLTLSYSVDSGQSWTEITNTISPASFAYLWSPPSGISSPVKLKIENSAYADESDGVFALLPSPSNITIEKACCSTLMLTWQGVAAADSYRVYILDSLYMKPVGTTNTTSFTIQNINAFNENWVSVSAIKAGVESMRAVAVKKEIGTFQCDADSNLSLLNIASPGEDLIASCLFEDSIPVTLTVANYSPNDLSDPILYYNYQGQTVSYQPQIVIKKGERMEITFPKPIPLPGAGDHSLSAWVDQAGDQNYCDDSLEVVFREIGNTSVTAPWRADLESNLPCNTAPNCGFTVCNLNKGLTNAPNGTIDDIDWRIDISGTTTFGTGPSLDHRPGTGLGRYLYLEASGDCIYQSANLYFPCFDLTGLQNPKFSLWYHMYGQDMGTLEFFINDGSGWVLANEFSGNLGNTWHNYIIDLNAWKGQTVQLKIVGTTGGGFASDMALDDFYLYDDVALEGDIESEDTICVGREYNFNASFNTNVSRIKWDFGTDAAPANAIDQKEVSVLYHSAGQKTVTLKLYRLEDSLTIQKSILVTDTPEAHFTFLPLGNGQVQFLNQSRNANQFKWKFGSSDSSTLKDPVFTLPGSSALHVELTAMNNGCSTTTAIDLMPKDWYFEDPQMLLFPNPADRNTRLQILNPLLSEIKIQVVGSDGRKLWDSPVKSIGNNQFELDTSLLPAGIYIIKVLSGETQFVKKLIIIHQ